LPIDVELFVVYVVKQIGPLMHAVIYVKASPQRKKRKDEAGTYNWLLQ
jgi:hypothetical protein